MYHETKNKFKDVAKGQMLCRMVTDMGEIEKAFYESLVNEVVFKTPLTLSDHAVKQMTSRNLSIGKVRYIYFEGALTEIQFDNSGIKAILSYSTKAQSKKGFSSNIVLDLISGKVISVWNRQHWHDANKNSSTYKGHKSYIIHNHKNTFNLLNQFMPLDCFKEPIKLVQFLRKYNPNFSSHHEKKLNNFLQGTTLLEQL